MLATLMAYETVPFETTDGHFAANAKDFLAQHANWLRQPDVKVMWNRVTEDDNPRKAVPATTLPSSSPTPVWTEKHDCHGVSGNLWVVNRTLAVQNVGDFCGQTSKFVEYVYRPLNLQCC